MFRPHVRFCDLLAAQERRFRRPRLGFREGSKTFINQGTNGRWRGVLTPAEIEKADQIAAPELTPDCAAWLRSGDPI